MVKKYKESVSNKQVANVCDITTECETVIDMMNLRLAIF